ncbi:MAG TPA: hypothetical protein VHG08_20185 [Longimicrobium sp.]|nr:hypothetical protein [Longimicrobium sp.]
MRITLVLRPDVAEELRSPRPAPGAARALLETAGAMGVALRPTHPGATDALLVPFYHAEVPDPTAAGQVLERLRAAEGVEAAYLKPPEALP